MTRTRILHCADIHFDPRDPAPALASLRTVAEYVASDEVALVVVAGDLFDRPVRSASADGMPELLEVCARVIERAPVMSVYGTPSHDAPGCYAPLARMAGRYGWHALGPADAGVVYALTDRGTFDPHYIRCRRGSVPRLLVSGLPEPGLAWLLRGDGASMGRAEAIERVTAQLRTILAGIGVTWEWDAVPRVHVQHGEIVGARTAEGQTLPPGGIAVSADDLALTGADYVALGHIHLHQQVGHLRGAYYAGSAYPVDWGETDRKGFSVVDVERGRPPTIVRRPFPHAPRRKFVWTVDRPEHAIEAVRRAAHDEIAGSDVWVVVEHPAECRPGGTGDALRELLRDAGAGEMRIDFEARRVERVRVPEITTADGWAAQVRAWGGATSTEITDAHADALSTLEADLASSGAIPRPRRWRLRSLRLRGAIGVWRGSGRDEVVIDLDAYGAGLVALTGPNGSGKTTILEHLTPWPSMLTRSGPLQDHFRQRDSCRDLRIVDDETGEQYQCVIHVDAQTGRRTQRVYRDGEPLGADGSTEAYVGVVDGLWGPRSIYLISMCTPQRPVSLRIRGDDGESIIATTDLAAASNGMRRAILRQLLGLGAYQAGARRAQDNARADAEAAERSERQAAPLDTDADRLPEVTHQLGELRGAESDAEGRVFRAADEVKRQRGVVEAAEQSARDHDAVAAEIAAVVEQTLDAAKERKRLETEVRESEGAIAHLPAAEAAVAAHTQRAERRAELVDQRSEAAAERERLMAEYGRVAESAESKRVTIRQSVDRLRERRMRATMDLTAARKECEVVSNGRCGACGQRLPAAKLAELNARADGEQRRMEGLQGTVERCDAELAVLAGALEAIPSTTSPTPPPWGGERELSAVEAEIKANGSAVGRGRETVERAARAQGAIESARQRIDALNRRIAELDAHGLKRADTLDPDAAERYRSERSRLDELVDAEHRERGEHSALKVEMRHAIGDVERCRIAERRRAELRAGIAERQHNAETWRLLGRALGPDGVQSLLLECAAPEVSRVATDLLARAYGRRWEVRVELQRPAGTGGKRRFVEDLRIIVRDATTTEVFDADLGPGEQTLETLSGGEGVWVRAALAAAIGEVRARQTGQRYATALLDEADAGLDDAARAAYWRLVEAAHTAGGRHQTVVITHHSDVQIAQRIAVDELPEAAGVR